MAQPLTVAGPPSIRKGHATPICNPCATDPELFAYNCITSCFGSQFHASDRLPQASTELAKPGFKAANAALGWALSGLRERDGVAHLRRVHVRARGYEEAGLGRRIALVPARTMGRRTLTVAYAVAMGAVVLMVIPRLVSWDDILANKQAWNTLVWFATLRVADDGRPPQPCTLRTAAPTRGGALFNY